MPTRHVDAQQMSWKCSLTLSVEPRRGKYRSNVYSCCVGLAITERELVTSALLSYRAIPSAIYYGGVGRRRRRRRDAGETREVLYVGAVFVLARAYIQCCLPTCLHTDIYSINSVTLLHSAEAGPGDREPHTHIHTCTYYCWSTYMCVSLAEGPVVPS